MSTTRCIAATMLDHVRFAALLHADPQHPHVHLVDMPFRATSTWQDRKCVVGMWEKDAALVAWAVFQPPWQTLDYAVAPAERGSALEAEVFAWGLAQMTAYARRSGAAFDGAVELFEDTPQIERTVKHLAALGFQQLDWSTIRFEIDARHAVAPPQLHAGYRIRPWGGTAETQAYVSLVQAVFGANWMTEAWRTRMLAHPAYRPELDLAVVDADNVPVGFCTGWLREQVGQIEPLGIHPDHQGKGLGRALERAACAALQRYGARRMYIDHGSTNEPAIALSLQTGFRQRNNALRYGIRIHLP